MLINNKNNITINLYKIIIMNIKYLSDIHLEFIQPGMIRKFIKNINNVTNADICILAGDIGNPYSENYKLFFTHINSIFPKTFVIAGNHEFYNNDKEVYQTREYLKTYFNDYPNVSFLDNSTELYKNHLFIGTTLWSHISKPQFKINDVYAIKKLNVDTYNFLHSEAVGFLSNTLEQAETNCIVISHHMPSKIFIDNQYTGPKYVNYNQWFYSNQDDLMKKFNSKIKCWFYGHTHTPLSIKYDGIQYCCNPIGYPGENDYNNFNQTITIE